jgi:hypothetical protein
MRRYLPPKDHLAAIGAIAVLWTAIESIMEMTILGLYEIDAGRGLVLTSNLTFHARLSLLRILSGEDGAITDAALAAEMRTILSRIDTAFGERNTIVHGLYGPTDRPGVINRMSVRARGKKLTTARENYDGEAFRAIVERFSTLATDFADLGTRLKIEDRLATAPRHSSTSK